MGRATLEIKLSGEDVLPFVEQKLKAAGLDFWDIRGGDGECTIFVQVERRQKSELEQGLEVLDACNALHPSGRITRIQ